MIPGRTYVIIVVLSRDAVQTDRRTDQSPGEVAEEVEPAQPPVVLRRDVGA